MEHLESYAALWPLFLSILGLVIWAVRLEARVTRGDERQGETVKRVDILNTKHDALDSKVVEQLAEVRESLARIEGALGVPRQN